MPGSSAQSPQWDPLEVTEPSCLAPVLSFWLFEAWFLWRLGYSGKALWTVHFLLSPEVDVI